jgi:hypothetical protein
MPSATGLLRVALIANLLYSLASPFLVRPQLLTRP